MKLSIIIPAYNEKDTIVQSVHNVLRVNFPYPYEIIIVDDGSTDGTSDILKDFVQSLGQVQPDQGIKVIFRKKNQGKGAALRHGLEKATGDIIAIQDADLEYDPQDLLKLIDPILSGKTSVVYGSRFLTDYNPGKYKLHHFGNKLISFLFRLLYHTKITDPATCYKVFRREILYKIPPLKLNGFEMEPELTAKILRKGYTIIELPISYQPRSFVEGKKITWRHAFRYIFTIIKYRFVRIPTANESKGS